MKKDQICEWCLLTGVFLQRFDRNKERHGFNFVNSDFLNYQKFSPGTSFSYFNQGVILMLCYGLLVYPLESWESLSDCDYEEIDKLICDVGKQYSLSIKSVTDLFVIDIPVNKLSLSSKNLFRHMRNAVAHARVDIDIKNNKFIFKDVDRNIKKFTGSIYVDNILMLLNGTAKFFYGRVVSD